MLYKQLDMITEQYKYRNIDCARKLLENLKSSHKTYGEIFEEIKKAERDIMYTHSAHKHLIQDIFYELKKLLEEEISLIQLKPKKL